VLGAVSSIVAPALHTIFVTVRSRLSTYPHPRPSPPPLPLPARFFRPAGDRSPIFSREHRFFSALLPEPQNGAKMRYRFAEPGLAADRSADLVRASIPLLPLSTLSFYPFRCVDKHRSASAFFSISILCSRDERRVLATIPRESPLDGDACDHVYLIDGRAKDGRSVNALAHRAKNFYVTSQTP